MPLGLIALISACSFPRPKQEDPTPILGCFVAPNAPSFAIDEKDLRVAGASIATPYSYEQHKIGMMIRTGLTPSIVRGRLIFQSGDDQFLRVVLQDGKPTIIVIFGVGEKTAAYREYRPVEAANCSP